MKKTLICYLTVFVMVGTLLFGGLAYYSHIYTKNLRAKAAIQARQDALAAAVEVVRYRAAQDYIVGNGTSSTNYSSAIIGLYTRLVDTYIKAYTADLS